MCVYIDDWDGMNAGAKRPDPVLWEKVLDGVDTYILVSKIEDSYCKCRSVLDSLLRKQSSINTYDLVRDVARLDPEKKSTLQVNKRSSIKTRFETTPQRERIEGSKA